MIPTKKIKEIKKEAAKASQDKLELESSLPKLITEKVGEEIRKLDMLKRNESMRFNAVARVNSQTNPDQKYLADLPFSFLRRMAQIYPIARACINRRIRQITQLDWDITTIDEIEEEAGYEEQIKTVKAFFKQPIGHKTRMREMLTMMTDDLLTLDAVSFEMQKTRGGEFMHLIPVDPATIVLKVTEQGGTPVPPQTAYRQIIQGQVIAEFTTDEMIYDFMGNRSYSPYGLAPLESLILQVESAIRGAMYNLNYFRENNVPEGFIDLPDDVATNRNAVEEWQMWFDSLLAGDARMVHRLKILPGGAKYTAAKKPEDMAFERFEVWLLQQTCAMFDVQPQDIGITLHVNKATADSQADIGRERGLIPLGNFFKEVFDDIVQVEMQQENLQFVWLNINPVDRKEEVEIAEKEIKMGTLGVDEFRIEQGREALGLEPYIDTPSGPLLVADVVSGKVGPAADAKRADTIASQPKVLPTGSTGAGFKEPEQKGEAVEQAQRELEDLRKWKKAIYNDLEVGRKLRVKFPSSHIAPEIHEQIAERLADVHSKMQAKLVFDEYLDPQIRAAMMLMRHATELRRIEHDALT